MIVRLHQRKIPALLPGGMPVVFAPDVGEGHVLAEEKAGVGNRYILSESYQDLLQLVRVVLEEFDTAQKMPPVLPLPAAKGVSIVGEWVADIINKPPLIPKGQLHFLQWGATPRSDKAKQELGWSPLPFREGIRKTIEFLT
jgi:dihydroflavonol-4-reductase